MFAIMDSILAAYRNASSLVAKGLRVLSVIALMFVAGSCEKENWNLVSPSGAGDSISVRFINLCGDGRARALVLDGKFSTEEVRDSSASAVIASPSDSAFISVWENDLSMFSISGRVRFAKQSMELFIAVPTLPSNQQPKALDTLLHFNTSRTLLPIEGFGQIRLIVASDDITASYSMREGCPNGTGIGSPVSTRNSNAYSTVPAGTLVFSLLRGSDMVGTYSVSIRSRGSHTIIVTKRRNESAVVRTLNEDDGTSSAMQSTTTVAAANRVSVVRVINVSAKGVDSVVANATQAVGLELAARSVGQYVFVRACSGSNTDEFALYAKGSPVSTLRTSLGVLSRYSIVCFDTATNGGQGGGNPSMVFIPPSRTLTSADSATVRVVHCASWPDIVRVRLGARTDAKGVFHNGELLAQDVRPGNVSSAVRVPAGAAPLTVLSMAANRADLLRGCAVASFKGGKEYILALLPGSDAENTKMSLIESDDESSTVTELPEGVFTQVVQAGSDRAPVTVTINGIVQATSLTFGNALATVVGHGSQAMKFGALNATFTADSMRRLTVVLAGTSSAIRTVTLNAPSMNPAVDTARSRYLNVTGDVSRVRVSIDSVANLGYNVYADNLEFGVLSDIRTEVKPRRINFVCGDATTLNEFFRPSYSVTLLAGKAYTVIVSGTKNSGYSIILQQEY